MGMVRDKIRVRDRDRRSEPNLLNYLAQKCITLAIMAAPSYGGPEPSSPTLNTEKLCTI